MNNIKFISTTIAIIVVTLAQSFQFALADKNNKLQNHKNTPLVHVQSGKTHGKPINSSHNIAPNEQWN